MKINNDWRLMNQERYLMAIPLKYNVWKQTNPNWTHDHCAFCQATFSELPQDIHTGYCSLDERHWICDECFNDFAEMFQWNIACENGGS